MNEPMALKLQFVESAPDQLQEGTLYVSMEFATALHKCVCGCGNEVVTPFSPTDWKLYFDGVSVSLTPSIGNWSFPCQSHYWIRRNRIEWAPQWSKVSIEQCREMDRRNKQDHFGEDADRPVLADTPTPPLSWWQLIKKKLGFKRKK